MQTHNIDYAWSSAETGNKFINDLAKPYRYSKECRRPGKIDNDISCVPGLQQQVSYYLSDLKKIHQAPGKKTLYVLWAGGNDIFNDIKRFQYRFKYFHEQPSLLFLSYQYSFSWFPTFNIYQAVNQLIDAGVPANNIYVFNLINLAQTPAARHLSQILYEHDQKAQQRFLYMLNLITRVFNFDLEFWMKYGIRGAAKPHVVQINQLFQRMKVGDRFLGYDFKDSTHSCVREKATPFCIGYFFFNDKHPTTRTGKLLAQYLARNV